MIKFHLTRAIIFDLDGTLVDSAEDLNAVMNRVLAERGLRAIGAEEIKGMIGDGVAKLVERAIAAAGGDPAHQAALTDRFLAIYQANPAALTRCYPGVVETLAKLRSRQFRLAVVTNKPIKPTRSILRALSLADYFSVVIGGDSLPGRKPDPAQLLEVARQFDLDVGEVLMVGDNIHDIEAARAARMRCIAVSYGYHHRPPAEFRADHLVDRFAEILPLVADVAPHRGGANGKAECDFTTRSSFSRPEPFL